MKEKLENNPYDQLIKNDKRIDTDYLKFRNSLKKMVEKKSKKEDKR